MSLTIFLAPSIAAAVTLACAFALMPYAEKLGLIDAPGGRKRHLAPTPLVGGLAITIGSLSLIAWPSVQSSSLAWLWPAIAILVVIGIFDDRQELTARTRISAQIGASLVLIYGASLSLTTVGNLFGSGIIALGSLGVALTVFASISAINAFNMADGLDGLASGLALIPMVIVSLLLSTQGFTVESTIASGFAAATAVFMLLNYRFPWNKRARTFLGDTGSTVLGFVTAALVIFASENQLIRPVTALFLIAIPLFDIASVTTIRLIQKRSPFSPGRDHLHHILREKGASVSSTVLYIHAFSLSLACTGLLLDQLMVPEVVSFCIFATLLVTHITTTARVNLANSRTTTNASVQLVKITKVESDPYSNSSTRPVTQLTNKHLELGKELSKAS